MAARKGLASSGAASRRRDASWGSRKAAERAGFEPAVEFPLRPLSIFLPQLASPRRGAEVVSNAGTRRAAAPPVFPKAVLTRAAGRAFARVSVSRKCPARAPCGRGRRGYVAWLAPSSFVLPCPALPCPALAASRAGSASPESARARSVAHAPRRAVAVT